MKKKLNATHEVLNKLWNTKEYLGFKYALETWYRDFDMTFRFAKWLIYIFLSFFEIPLCSYYSIMVVAN